MFDTMERSLVIHVDLFFVALVSAPKGNLVSEKLEAVMKNLKSKVTAGNVDQKNAHK